MRVTRSFRSILRIKRRRGYYRTPGRPGRFRPARAQRYLPVGGIIVGPPGARRWALGLVRREVKAGSYVTDWRLSAALDRMLARLM